MYVKGIHDKDLIFHLETSEKTLLLQGCGLEITAVVKMCSVAQLCPPFCDPFLDCIAHQTPLSTGFFRQEYWSGFLFTPPGDLPKPEIEPLSPASPYIGRQILYY